MPAITIFEDDDGDKWDVAEGRLLIGGHAIADAREFADFLQAELAKAEPDKPDDDGWIEWNGGECPVDYYALVDLTFRDGDVSRSRRADFLRWQHERLPGDIMRYRPAKGGKA